MHRTIRHAPPDMTKTLQKLNENIERTNPHHYLPRRTARYLVPDQAAAAMTKLLTKTDPSQSSEKDIEVDTERAEVESEDLFD